MVFIYKKEVLIISKRSQITIFIILGIVLVIAIGFVLVVNSPETEQQEVEIEKSVLPKMEKEPFDVYIKNCLQDAAAPLIGQMITQGGALEPLVNRQDARVYYSTQYRYFCKYTKANGCVNELITREGMEEELGEKIGQDFIECVDLEGFREQGYIIETGPLEITASINVDDVSVTAKFPIKVSRTEFLFGLDTFATKLDMPLGRLYDLAVYITNNEILNRTFDKDGWMSKTGADITIEKHKPYPDTVYKLNTYVERTGKNYTFNFAIHGYDTVSIMGMEEPVAIQGYCYFQKDNNCFANSDKNRCESKGGIYKEDPSEEPAGCSSPTEFELTELCDGQPCKDCDDRKHGETWCIYDGVTGQGFDRVGSRHFKQSCINGKIYTEECRDFREELCTAQEKAVCRENRWQDCALQSNPQDCENSELRDCTWHWELKDTKDLPAPRCGPYVPPGFRFWNGDGYNICALGNDIGECKDEKTYCPSNWNNWAAFYCYSLGDCGNYRNYLGEVTEVGFFNSDLIAYDLPVNPRVYMDRNIEAAPLTLRTDVNNRVTAKYDWHPYIGISYLAHPTYEEFQGFIMDYVDKAMDWDICDIFDCDLGLIPKRPLHDHFNKYILGLSICATWKAPHNGDCEICNTDPVKPCSEYRCKSISSRCNYYEDLMTGVGTCETPRPSSADINIEFVNPPESYRFKDAYFNWKGRPLFGKEIKPKVAQESEMTFKIKTDENATCWLAPLPEYIDMYSGGAVFTMDHEMTISIPEIEIYISKIKGLMNLNSFSDAAANPGKIPGNEENQFKFYQMVQETFPGLMPGEIDALVNSFKQLLTDADSDRFYLFIKCADKFGNMNKYSTFVSLVVSGDNEPPEVEIISPADQATMAAGPVTFRYKVKDNAAYRMLCSLWYNTTTERWHKASVSELSMNNVEAEINVPSLAAEEYMWSISCSEGFNKGFGENRTIIITG